MQMLTLVVGVCCEGLVNLMEGVAGVRRRRQKPVSESSIPIDGA